MSRTLRTGLIGLGAMGRHHARVLAGLEGVELVAIADPDGDPHGRGHGAGTGAGVDDSYRITGDEIRMPLTSVAPDPNLSSACPARRSDSSVPKAAAKGPFGTARRPSWTALRRSPSSSQVPAQSSS